MNYGSLLFASLVLTFAVDAYPDAFKCKTPEGKVVISSAPCRSGSKTEAVQPSDEISTEERQRAEKALERDQKLLAEREAARAAVQQREQESQRKQAGEESLRQTQCLNSAQREPDAQLRASLIAACTGAPSPQPFATQEPLYYPVAPIPDWSTSGSGKRCVSNDCARPHDAHPAKSTSGTGQQGHQNRSQQNQRPDATRTMMPR